MLLTQAEGPIMLNNSVFIFGYSLDSRSLSCFSNMLARYGVLSSRLISIFVIHIQPCKKMQYSYPNYFNVAGVIVSG